MVLALTLVGAWWLSWMYPFGASLEDALGEEGVFWEYVEDSQGEAFILEDTGLCT